MRDDASRADSATAQKDCSPEPSFPAGIDGLVENGGGAHQRGPGLHRDVQVITRLPEARVERVVRGDLRAALAESGIAIHDAVPVAVACENRFHGVDESRLIPREPGKILRVPHIKACGQYPVERFLVAHEAEAAGEPRHFVRRGPLRRETVRDALIMRERQPVLVAVRRLREEEIKFAADGPRRVIKLVKRLIDREVEGIHHLILTLVHDEDGRAGVIDEKFGTREIAVRGVRNKKLSLVGKGR